MAIGEALAPPPRGGARPASARPRRRSTPSSRPAAPSCPRARRSRSPRSSEDTRNDVIPREPAEGSVIAMTTYHCASPGVGDPGLGAVQDVASLRRGPRGSSGWRRREPDCGSVRAYAPSAFPDASSRRIEVFCASLPKLPDRKAGHRVGHRDDDRRRGAHASQLLDREHVGEDVGAGASVLLGHHHPQDPHLAELLDDLRRKAPGLLPLGDARGDLRPRELAHGVADPLLVFGQLEVHGAAADGGPDPPPPPPDPPAAPGGVAGTAAPLATRPPGARPERLRRPPRRRDAAAAGASAAREDAAADRKAAAARRRSDGPPPGRRSGALPPGRRCGPSEPGRRCGPPGPGRRSGDGPPRRSGPPRSWPACPRPRPPRRRRRLSAPRLGRVDPALLEVAEGDDDLGLRGARPDELHDLRAQRRAGLGRERRNALGVEQHHAGPGRFAGSRRPLATSSMTKRSRSWSSVCSRNSSSGRASRHMSLSSGRCFSPPSRVCSIETTRSRNMRVWPMLAVSFIRSPARVSRKISRAMISRWISLVPS